MRLKNDLLIAVIIAIIVHLGMAFADISVEYPTVSVRKEDAHYLKITFVTPTKDSETKVQKKPIPLKSTPKRVIRKKNVPLKTHAIRRKIDLPRRVRHIEEEKVVAREVEKPESEEVKTEIPIRSDAEPPDATPVKAEPVSPAMLISPAVPRYKENTPPAYPRQARRRGYEGIVLLSVMVLDNGAVGEVRIKTSSGHSCLDTVALKTVKKWRFEPAIRLGTAIPMWVDVPVRFTLKGRTHS